MTHTSTTNTIFVIISILLIPFFSIAQSWKIDSLGNERTNFFEIQASFNKYWEGKEIFKGCGWKPFKRWENYWENRVLPDGSFPPAGIVLAEFEKYRRENRDGNRTVQSANWQSLGPSSSAGGYAGLGRIASIAFHPSNTNIVYAGTAGGGLWVTTNSGSTWQTYTDNIGSLGVSGICVHPNTPNTIYIATGDGDGGDNSSIGVLKSLDGGLTFNPTGLVWNTSQSRTIRKMIMHPDNPNILMTAGSNGIYRSIDAGANWSQVVSNISFYDLEAKPLAGSNVFYAATSTQVYRSTDNGVTWNSIYTINTANRLAITVTAANPEYLYVLASLSSNSGFQGLHQSTDSGNNFVLKSNTPNILGYSGDGGTSGGQGWYDLVITADPANASTIYIGGVNCWKSTDSGASWTLKSHWAGSPGVNTVHADKHVLEWQGTTLYEGNDGGIYRTSNGGNTWAHISSGIINSQMYRLGVSQTNNAVITGLQDNGTKALNNSNNWFDEIGGDGMECAINPTNAQIMYGELYYGDIERTTNGGNSWTNITNNNTDNPSGAWITPFELEPNNPTTIYAAYENLYKSTNQGNTWTKISNGVGTSDKTLLGIAPSNANYIYMGTSNAIYRTTNGGTTWSTMTTPGNNMTMLRVHPTDPNTIFVTRSNYSANAKVYKSTNGGSTWVNISGTLPNIPANCIVLQTNASQGIYVGMDIGVYYRDNDLADWILYNENLPNVEITELDINYSNNKIYASTYGRGLWNGDLYSSGPVCLPPNNLVVTDLTTTSISFAWNAPTTPPNSYQYVVQLTNTNPSTGTSTTSTNAAATNLTPNTSYYIYVRSVCDDIGPSPWVSIGPIRTLLTCNNTSYDTGGSGQQYSDNEDIVFTICPTSGVYTSILTFTLLDIEADWDALYIFDGPNINAPLLPSSNPATNAGFPAGGYYGNQLPPVTISTHSTGCLTLRFRSDETVTEDGWVANITCMPRCQYKVDNTDDVGIGSLRNEIECAQDGASLFIYPTIYGQTVQLTSGPIAINKNLTIELPLGELLDINTTNIGPIFTIQAGKSLTLKNINLHGGTNTTGSAIINNGNLILDNVNIFQNHPTSSTSSAILNQGNGSVTIKGNTAVKPD